eukprot:scaffold102016_cov39-Phaeocystis_antarctica.AAC.1
MQAIPVLGASANPQAPCAHLPVRLRCGLIARAGEKLTLLVLLRADAGGRVRYLDVQLVGTLDNLLALTRRNVVRDLSGIFAILHHKHLKLLDVVHDKLVEAAGQHVPRPFVRAIANIHQQRQALEPG